MRQVFLSAGEKPTSACPEKCPHIGRPARAQNATLGPPVQVTRHTRFGPGPQQREAAWSNSCGLMQFLQPDSAPPFLCHAMAALALIATAARNGDHTNPVTVDRLEAR